MDIVKLPTITLAAKNLNAETFFAATLPSDPSQVTSGFLTHTQPLQKWEVGRHLTVLRYNRTIGVRRPSHSTPP